MFLAGLLKAHAETETRTEAAAEPAPLTEDTVTIELPDGWPSFKPKSSVAYVRPASASPQTTRNRWV